MLAATQRRMLAAAVVVVARQVVAAVALMGPAAAQLASHTHCDEMSHLACTCSGAMCHSVVGEPLNDWEVPVVTGDIYEFNFR